MMGMGIGVGFSSPPPWTPAALGAVGRWSAEDVLLSGAAVTAFVDTGSGGHNATQANAANQGTYAAAGNPAGGPQVTFDGNDYYFTSAFPTAQPFTIVAALKPTWTADGDVYFDGLALPNRFAMYTFDGTSAIVQTNTTNKVTVAMLTNGSWQTSEVSANGAASTIAINGGARTTIALTAEPQGGITIGSDLAGAGNPAKMVFYELCLVPRAVTAGEWALGNAYYHGKVGA